MMKYETRIVPHDAVALVGHEKGHAYRFTGRRIIVVFAIDGAAPIVQNPLLVLSESVVVLIGRRRKSRPHPEGLFAVHRVRRHFPTAHSQDGFAAGRAYGERYRG